MDLFSYGTWIHGFYYFRNRSGCFFLDTPAFQQKSSSAETLVYEYYDPLVRTLLFYVKAAWGAKL
jgi:hypothetical protein